MSRKILYVFALVSLILFVYSAVHLVQQFSNPSLPYIGELKGFEDNNRNNEFKELAETFRQKIAASNSEAATDQQWYFWLSFVVTALSAGSTLVSSIQAAKKDSTNPNRALTFAIVVAVLTFCSTLANFAATHFNELKTEATKKATDLTNMRNQFYADYKNATPEAKPSVITDYTQKLD